MQCMTDLSRAAFVFSLFSASLEVDILVTYICKYTPVELLSALGQPSVSPNEEVEDFASADAYLHSSVCAHARQRFSVLVEEPRGSLRPLVRLFRLGQKWISELPSSLLKMISSQFRCISPRWDFQLPPRIPVTYGSHWNPQEQRRPDEPAEDPVSSASVSGYMPPWE